MHVDDIRKMQAEKDHKMRNGSDDYSRDNWRNPEARDRDRARIAALEKQYQSEETARKIYGKKPSHGYAGDKSHAETREEIDYLKSEDKKFED